MKQAIKIGSVLLVFLLVLGLAACTNSAETGDEDVGLSTADLAKADKLLADYEAARAIENWEGAEAKADQIKSKYADSEAAGKLKSSLGQVRAKAEQAREARRLQALWDYQSVPAEGGVQRSASIFSKTVAVEEGSPLTVPDAQLVLRDHPAWGRSAYLLLAQSKFQCGEPCTVKISFVDVAAQTWAAKQADSGQGPALFIEDEQGFIAQMDNSDNVRITLPEGSGFAPSVTFEVGGYDAALYAKP